MLTFKAKPKQIMQMLANVANAARPVRLGWLNYDEKHRYEPEEFEKNVCDDHGEPKDHCGLDYYGGRQVKLFLSYNRRTGEYSMPDSFNSSYQSFVWKYANPEMLLESVGITEYRYD